MADHSATGQEKKEQLSLAKAADNLLGECRMVLPGIQALFGFQLVAVFNSRFEQALSRAEQDLHLAALALAALAIAMVMTPAAYHRQTTPYEITETFIALSTRLLRWAMLPLALSVVADFYLISRIIAGGTTALLAAAGLFGVFVLLWFVLPRAQEVTSRTLLARGARASRAPRGR